MGFCVGRQFASVRSAVLLAGYAFYASCSSASAVSLGCSSASLGCKCEAIDSCTCNIEFSRCVCRDEVAALLRDGRCIATSSARMVQEGRLYGNCGKDEVQFSAVLIVATAPSPEAKLDNLRRGKPSLPLVSILHWSAASALGVPPEQIRLFDVKLTADAALNRSSEKGENGGLLLFDASFTGCALDSVELAPGGVFERRFAQAWQKFAAFPVATLRLLELKGDPRDTAAITRHPPPHLPPGATDSADHAEENQSLEWKDFVWLFPAGGLAVVLLCVTSWQLVRLRRWSKRARDSPRHWRDIAPTTHLQQHQLEAQALPDGPGGGSLASIAHDFDPNSDDGNVFAASAGLEATECLKISEGDLLEVLARGDGWLYGRRSGDGLFGYVPEPCVCWIVGESEASRPPLLVDAPLQVGIRESSEATSMPNF